VPRIPNLYSIENKVQNTPVYPPGLAPAGGTSTGRALRVQAPPGQPPPTRGQEHAHTLKTIKQGFTGPHSTSYELWPN